MTARLETIGVQLFVGVMAPLVLGGAMRPGRVIGPETAWELAAQAREIGGPAIDARLAARVHDARVRRARLLVPVDAMDPATGAEWALAAALHDVLQAANPRMKTALRRGAAARIADGAAAMVERIDSPATAREALSRHAWFARILDIARTDTLVSWWSGWRAFRGVDPPTRVQAWPKVRRVKVTRAASALLDLTPLAIDRERFVEVVGGLLACSPLTDVGTCTRKAPAFVWNGSILGLLATPVGRTLALRTLARLPRDEVDAALGRATREALAPDRVTPRVVLTLLADRAIEAAQGREAPLPRSPGSPELTTDASVARALGATAALEAMRSPGAAWSTTERRLLIDALEPAARQVS